MKHNQEAPELYFEQPFPADINQDAPDLDFEQHFPTDINWTEHIPKYAEWYRSVRLSQRSVQQIPPKEKSDEVTKMHVQFADEQSYRRSVVEPESIDGFSDHYSDMSVSTDTDFEYRSSDIYPADFFVETNLQPPEKISDRKSSPKISKLYYESGFDWLASEDLLVKSTKAELEEKERERSERFKNEVTAVPMNVVWKEEARKEAKRQHRCNLCIWITAGLVIVAAIGGVLAFVFLSGAIDQYVQTPTTTIQPIPTPSPTPTSDTTPTASRPLGTQWIQHTDVLKGVKAGDNFGQSIAYSRNGRVVAVGADQHTTGGRQGDSRGYVKVFESNNEGGSSQLGQTLLGDSSWDQAGFSVGLSDDGMILAVGFHGNMDYGFFTGKVKIYDYDADSKTWEQVGDDLVGDVAHDNFGYSVSLSSDGFTIAVGARSDTVGFVRVFTFSPSNDKWLQKGNDLAGDTEGCSFGEVDLAGDGDRLVCRNVADVRAFEYSNYYWKQLGYDIGLSVTGDESGKRMVISSDGTRIAVVDGQGRLRVFVLENGDWRQEGRSLAEDRNSDSSYASVSINSFGTVVALGIPNFEMAGGKAGMGMVIVYSFDGRYWEQLGDILVGTSENEGFGRSVALSADARFLAIGAFDDVNGNSGYVGIFELE